MSTSEAREVRPRLKEAVKKGDMTAYDALFALCERAERNAELTRAMSSRTGRWLWERLDNAERKNILNEFPVQRN